MPNLVVMKIIPKQHQKVSNWSGGTTTELFIFPEDATVSEQNFEYRISTAQVLVEKSEFTSFPKFNRKLAILEGKLKIQHNQSEWYVLEAGKQSEFNGEWKTRSEGQVIDFNVIYSSEYGVEVTFVDQLVLGDFNQGGEVIGIYCLSGSGSINDLHFQNGDFINANGEVLSVKASENALFLKVIIYKL